jgi:signal peptidase I
MGQLEPRDNFGPYLVPKNKLFMMGDNRDQSYDSRFWGYVDIKQVRGKAMIIYWSWDSIKTFPRFDRIGKLIH